MNTKTSPQRRYEILKDTREQRGWWFPESSKCIGTTVEKLDTGDYSIRSMSHRFVIEKKENLAEFVGCMVQPRFEREMERLETLDFPYLLLGFNLVDIATFPQNSGIPKYLWGRLKISSNYIMSKLNYYQKKFKTEIYLVGNRGKEVAEAIFAQMNELRED